MPVDQALPASRAQVAPEPLLCIDNVSVRFGGVRALDGVTCQVNAGEICGLIGPNGAGKTTLFNCITRLYAVASGSISFAGQRIDTVPARQIVSLGIARTFQNLGIYVDMTVLENVLLGAHHSHGGRFFQTVARPWTSDARRAADDRMVPLDPARARSRSRSNTSAPAICPTAR